VGPPYKHDKGEGPLAYATGCVSGSDDRHPAAGVTDVSIHNADELGL